MFADNKIFDKIFDILHPEAYYTPHTPYEYKQKFCPSVLRAPAEQTKVATVLGN